MVNWGANLQYTGYSALTPCEETAWGNLFYLKNTSHKGTLSMEELVDCKLSPKLINIKLSEQLRLYLSVINFQTSLC